LGAAPGESTTMATNGQRPPLPDGPYLVVGLARSGQAAARALVAAGHDVIGVDDGNPAGAERLREVGVEVHLDGDLDERSEDAGCVVKSPGVPRTAPHIRRALSLGIPVIGELELAWRLIPNRFVCVTGTNGKTTVTELLGHVWREAARPVVVAGNVGTPLASFAGTIDPDATVICEASSFQLEDTERFAPECALLLNVAPDHLDRHGDMDAYVESKLRAFALQRPGDIAIVDRSAPETAAIELPGGAREIDVADAELPFEPAGEWVIGPHNRTNARFAAVTALAHELPADAAQRAITTFPGVPHRLEPIATVAGVRFVNDSKATNVAAAVAALRSFEGGVHAIMGGSLKGGGFEDLAAPVAERCASVQLLGPAADPLARALAGSAVELHRAANLEEAVRAAAGAALPGQVVLLAPACASFDAYSDYEARGEHFRALVGALGAAP